MSMFSNSSIGGAKRTCPFIRDPHSDSESELEEFLGNTKVMGTAAKRFKFDKIKDHESPVTSSALSTGAFTGGAVSSRSTIIEAPIGGAGLDSGLLGAAESPPPRRMIPNLVPKQMPKTPYQIKRKDPACPFINQWEGILNSLMIQKNDKKFSIAAIEGAEGNFSQVYTLFGDSPFIEGVSNDNIVIKLFHRHRVDANAQDTVLGWVKTLIGQYKALATTDLPIIRIYNAETALEDGYIVAQKINPILESFWSKDMEPKELEKSFGTELKQFKHFFKFASEQKTATPLDLQLTNFGFNEEGQILLLDFKEESEDLFGEQCAFKMIEKQCAESVASGNPYVLNYLLTGSFI